MNKKVYCLFDDGVHIDCFETRKEAEEYALDLSNGLSRYWDIEELEYDVKCDCGNSRIDPSYDNAYMNIFFK